MTINYRTLRNAYRRLLLEGRLLSSQPLGVGVVAAYQIGFEGRFFEPVVSGPWLSESCLIVNEDKQYGGDATALEVLITYNVQANKNISSNIVEHVEDLRNDIIGLFDSLKPFELESGLTGHVMSYNRVEKVFDSNEGVIYAPIDILTQLYGG